MTGRDGRRDPTAYEDVDRLLAEDGTADDGAVAALDLDDDDLRHLYESMVRARVLDERGFSMQRQGRLETWVPCEGQEAAQVGAAAALGADDWLATYGRQHGAQLVRGRPMADALRLWGGRESGSVPPEGLNHLPPAVPIGTHLPHAVGVAWAAKLTGSGEVCLAHFGDGATSPGDFHEAMNFAGVFDAPVVFCCENNQYAISVPRERQTASPTIAEKATAYGFDGVQVDGNDVLGVYRAARRAVDRARAGDGPTLIEAVTYRRGPHTTSDDPGVYRDEAEEAAWADRDPIDRFERFLAGRGLWDEDYGEAVREDARAEAQAAAESVESLPEPDPAEMFEHALAEPTRRLRRQRERLREGPGPDGR